MAIDIQLDDYSISMLGEVNVIQPGKLNIGKGNAKTTISRDQINTKHLFVDGQLKARGALSAKKMISPTGTIGNLTIAKEVRDGGGPTTLVPGRITFGSLSTTVLTGTKIEAKNISAGSFKGLGARLSFITSDEITTKKIKVSGEITAKTIIASGEITARRVTEVSDARCKQDINGLSNSLDKIIGLQGVSFNWEENDLTGLNPPREKQLGFIAQDVEKIIPEAVTKDSTGRRSLAYSSIIPLLVEGMKTQQESIQLQSDKIESKTQENVVLQQKIVEIENKLDVLLRKV